MWYRHLVTTLLLRPPYRIVWIHLERCFQKDSCFKSPTLLFCWTPFWTVWTLLGRLSELSTLLFCGISCSAVWTHLERRFKPLTFLFCRTPYRTVWTRLGRWRIIHSSRRRISSCFSTRETCSKNASNLTPLNSASPTTQVTWNISSNNTSFNQI